MSDGEQKSWSQIIRPHKDGEGVAFGIDNAAKPKDRDVLGGIESESLRATVKQAVGLKDIAGPREETSFDRLLQPWDKVDEIPQASRSVNRRDEIPKRDFQQEGDALRKDLVINSRLNSVILGANEYSAHHYYTHYTSRLNHDFSNPPEEMVALRVLLANSAYAKSDMDRESQNKTPMAIAETFKVLRDTGWSHDGVGGGNIYENSAGTIIAALKGDDRDRSSLNRRAILPLTNSSFQAAIATCFACGDISCAMELVKRSNELLKHEGDPRPAALRITSNLLRDAYAYYDPGMRQRVDAVIAGQPAEFKQLYEQVKIAGAYGEVADFLKGADSRLIDNLIENRANWYSDAEVVNLNSREAALEKNNLQTTVEAALEQPEPVAYLMREVESIAESYVQGRVANAMAAELARRLHPELGLAVQVDYAVKKAKGQPSGYVGLRNEFMPVYGINSSGRHVIEGETPIDPQRAIERIPLEGRDLAEKIYRPDEINFKYLVQFIKSPGHATNEITRSLERTGKSPTEIAELKRAYAERMVPALSYLSTLADNDTTRAILEKEFGLGSYISNQIVDLHKNQTRLDQVIDQLRRFVGEDRFNEVLAGVKEGEKMSDRMGDEQPALDEARIDALGKAIPKEKEKFVKEKGRDAAQDARISLEVQTDSNLSLLQTEKAENDARKAELELQIAQVMADRPSLVARQTEIQSKPLKRGFLGIRAYTQDMQIGELGPIVDQIGDIDRRVDALKAEITTLSTVSDLDLQILEGKKQKLKNLQTALAA